MDSKYHLEIKAIRDQLKRFVPQSPLLYSSELSRRTGRRVWLKMESFQPTGSFKVRPAFYGLLSHLVKAQRSGVVTASSGNFAQAVAYAAQKLSIQATIVMMQKTAFFKVDRTRKLEAKVVFCGNTMEDRERVTKEIEEQTQAVRIHPFDSRETVLADGTLGLELLEQIPDDMSVLVPVSGGGLLAGTLLALKASSSIQPQRKISVLGVQSDQSQVLSESLKQKKRYHRGSFETRVDALVAPQLGVEPWSWIEKYCDGAINVDEKKVFEAMEFLANEHKVVVEPGGAIGVAALMSGQPLPVEENLVVLVTGGNVQLRWS